MLRRLSALSTVLMALALVALPARAADTVVSAPAPGSPEAVVASALEAALAGDFAAYLKTVHPDERATPTQRSERERYEWKRFKNHAEWYVKTRTPLTFVLVSRDGEGDNLRIFVRDQKNKDRMPVPVRLKRTGSGWGITTNSL